MVIPCSLCLSVFHQHGRTGISLDLAMRSQSPHILLCRVFVSGGGAFFHRELQKKLSSPQRKPQRQILSAAEAKLRQERWGKMDDLVLVHSSIVGIFSRRFDFQAILCRRAVLRVVHFAAFISKLSPCSQYQHTPSYHIISYHPSRFRRIVGVRRARFPSKWSFRLPSISPKAESGFPFSFFVSRGCG